MFLLSACDTEEGSEPVDPQTQPTAETPTSTPTSTPEWEAAFQPGPLVDIAQGSLSGVEEAGLRVFRGVPFAAPPVGTLRLRDPEPALAWNGPLDASTFGPACPQQTVALLDVLSEVDQTDEDCLTLNIWAHDDDAPRPVMVWIHGGAFFYGAGSQSFYDGTAVADEGVVVVSINYRLGALGFLAHEDLGAGVGNLGPGNFGLKDQIQALEWVQQNIAVFGGDPDNVTVFGESAGGISTCILATTPAAEGLMHKAILQSAVGCDHLAEGTEAGSIGGADGALVYGEQVVQALGCGDATDTLACLQTLPEQAFLDQVTATSVLTDYTSPFPVPWVDGSFVTEQPAAAYVDGTVDMPMIIGTNEDESTLFLATQAPLTWFGIADDVGALIGSDALAGPVLESYPIWQFPLPQDAFLTFATDAMFSCPSRALAEAASSGAPTYLYEFQDIQLTTVALGSHHALELPYLFDTFERMAMTPINGNRALGQAMRGAWTSFARTGAPQISGGWPAYGPDGRFLVLDDAWSTQADSGYRGGRCDDLEALGVVVMP